MIESQNNSRRYSWVDRKIFFIEDLLQQFVPPSKQSTSSGDSYHQSNLTPLPSAAELSEEDQALSVRLMRVNHTGEVAAQGLYHGHALIALAKGDRAMQREMLRLAEEELRHLIWCRDRILELSGTTSLLTLFWYWGSVTIGAMAAIQDREQNYAFIEETERQVTDHLDKYIAKLPPKDLVSRQVLQKIKQDEIHHANHAAQKHDTAIPEHIKVAMSFSAQIMKTVSYWI